MVVTYYIKLFRTGADCILMFLFPPVAETIILSFLINMHAFLWATLFISNTRLKLAKNQANAKQHLEADFLLFENYLFTSFTLSSKNNRTCSEK